MKLRIESGGHSGNTRIFVIGDDGNEIEVTKGVKAAYWQCEAPGLAHASVDFIAHERFSIDLIAMGEEAPEWAVDLVTPPSVDDVEPAEEAESQDGRFERMD
jgi:hypothetical protein